MKCRGWMLIAGAVFGCGGGNPASAGSDVTIHDSRGDLAQYVGTWSSCTHRTDGRYDGNTLKFDAAEGGIAFTPSIGLVGVFSDPDCAIAVPGLVNGVAPLAPTRIRSVSVVNVTERMSSGFIGTADQLPLSSATAPFLFVGFEAGPNTAWISANKDFSGVPVRYDRR